MSGADSAMGSSPGGVFSLLIPHGGGAGGGSRAGVAMLVEKHRKSLALGVLGVLALLLLLLLFLPLLLGAGSLQVGPTELLEEAGVIPAVLDAFSPQGELELSLGNNLLLDGARLPLPTAQLTPSVVLRALPEKPALAGRHVLVMVDPDAPSPDNPTAREWLHWIVTDILPDQLVSDTSAAVVNYTKPTPPEGRHRYVLAVYQQPEDMPPVLAPETRANFRLRQFAADHNLGDPIAALFFSTAPQE